MAINPPQPNWIQRRVQNFGQEWPNYVALGAGALGALGADNYFTHDLYLPVRALADLTAGGATYGLVRTGLSLLRTDTQDRTYYETRPPGGYRMP